MTIKIGTRPSKLALLQVMEIADRLPQARFVIDAIATKGDVDKVSPLRDLEGTDFFTYEIEKALIDGRIDAAVHSAKDLEEQMPAGLDIVAVTRSISPFECLVSRRKLKLSELPGGSIIGTSSKKRKAAIQQYRSDLIVKDIRGNIDERLEQVSNGDYDAVIVAHAALLRMGYEEIIAEIISPDVMEPHPLQGRLAVQVLHQRRDLYEIFRRIHEK